MNPNFNVQLKTYVVKPVVKQVEMDRPLEFLTELKHVSVISVNIISDKCPENEFISLIDECYVFLHSLISQYAGHMNTLNLCVRNIVFNIVFGIRGYLKKNDESKMDEICKNAINCATRILQEIKDITAVKNIFIGISTGIVCCGVVGHQTRKYYTIIGLPINKAEDIMDISFNKISCDYETVLYSRLNAKLFRSRGIRSLQQFGRCHVYKYLHLLALETEVSALDYCYPILGRMRELRHFDSILDDIGTINRSQSGILIEGYDRIGKSRLLDAFTTKVRKREMKFIRLNLHVSYKEKDYSVLYYIILQLLDVEHFNQIEERERILIDKLGSILSFENFCYLNCLMRVNFPPSDVYIKDSEMNRHRRTVKIFEMILKMFHTKIFMLLDNIHYIDAMSWQFLSPMLDNPNIGVAMTIRRPTPSMRISNLEMQVYKDKRLKKCLLHGLEPDLLPIFACQFLNIVGIPKELKRILQRRQDGHIGWCEIFLSSILQNNVLEFITVPYSDIKKYDLVLPNISLITKYPSDLTPEEQISSLQWASTDQLNVCVMSDLYSETDYDTNRNIPDMIKDIYSKMNPYEQKLITCGATLGKVFKRSLLQTVMLNVIPPYTAKAISEMYRIRLLKCGSLQRREFFYESLIFCVDKKRTTFSDMLHLLSCVCYHSPTFFVEDALPQYAYCTMLEFKTDLFRKVVFNIQSDEAKTGNHIRAANIYRRQARKCSSCGSGSFLNIPSKTLLMEEEITELVRSLSRIPTLEDYPPEREDWLRRSMLAMNTIARKESRISEIRIDAMRRASRVSRISFPYLHEELEKVDSRSLIDIPRFRKRLTVVFPKSKDPLECLDEFTYIDYRDCQCSSIVTHLLSKLYWHLEQSMRKYEIINHILEFSAGLLQVAQPTYAVKILGIGSRIMEIAEKEEWSEEIKQENITNKENILILLGDAYNMAGNQQQAKSNYLAILRSGGIPEFKSIICYNILLAVYCIPLTSPQPSIKKVSDDEGLNGNLKKIEIALLLCRLCKIYVIEGKLKKAQSTAIRSIKLGFGCTGFFWEKGEIYLTVVQVFYHKKKMELVRQVDKLMLNIVNTKFNWNSIEEIVQVTNVYLTMYQIRALKGELKEAVDIGIKALKISIALHLDKITLLIMPSLIEIMLWTKRINGAVDLLHQLFFLADNDTDLSAKTWYYALCLELMLDAGVIVESYKTSYAYYVKFKDNKLKPHILHDPQSLCRLTTCLLMYQTRLGYVINITLKKAVDYVKNMEFNNFSQIFSCCMGLECYLMTLLRCINLKQSAELPNLMFNIDELIMYLKGVYKYAPVIKPRFYMLLAYVHITRGSKAKMETYLIKAQKFATLQGNKLILASIIQNKRTWVEKIYNNMAHYWLEYIESKDLVAWQYIHNFTVNTWSSILYSLALPDLYV